MAIRKAPIATELDRRIQRHRAEMAHRRIEHESAAAELGALLREQIGLEALDATYDEYQKNKFAWLEDEEDTTADGEHAD